MAIGAGGNLGGGGSNNPGAGGTGAGGTGAGGSAAGGSAGSGAGGMDVQPSCPATALSSGREDGTISIGGASRSYIRYVPNGYTGDTPVPLLIDFHPLLSTSTYQYTNSGYRQKADEEGFVVVYPQGIDNAWNIGPCCTRERSVDDLGFALALVEKMKQEACIDPKRVYAAGYSMGGGMSHYLACNAADVFAAVAPAAFDLIVESQMPCSPSRPISVTLSRGTADFIVPYAGGPSSPPTPYPLPQITFEGAVGSFERWAEIDGCTGSPTDVGSGCQTYEQCSAGVEVTLCTKTGGGHVTGDPDLGWEHLMRHTLP